jgi:hypothetical protein
VLSHQLPMEGGRGGMRGTGRMLGGPGMIQA